MNLGLEHLKAFNQLSHAAAEDDVIVLLDVLNTSTPAAESLNELSNIRKVYQNLTELRNEIKEHGIDDRLKRLICSDTGINQIAPSIEHADDQAAIAELDIAIEGIAETIKSKIRDFVSKLKAKIAEAFRANNSIRESIQRILSTIDESLLEDFSAVANKRIAGVSLEYREESFAAVRRMLHQMPPLPDIDSTASTGTEVIAQYVRDLAAYGAKMCPPTKNSLVIWTNGRCEYKEPSNAAGTKPMSEFGITSFAKLKQLCDFVTSEDGSLIVDKRLFQISSDIEFWDKIEEVLIALNKKISLTSQEWYTLDEYAQIARDSIIATACALQRKYLLMAYSALIQIK